MGKRKTIEVENLRRLVNGMLALDTLSEDNRKSLCVLLDRVLHETGNYRGFNYVDWMNGGANKWRADGEPDNTQPYLGPEYKREYF